MNAFAEEFLDRQAHRWNPRTRKTNSRIVRENILLAFGNLTVDAITVKHVGDWFAALSERPGIANRAVPVPSMLMRMAGLWGYRVHNSNPCKSTRHCKMKPKERYLTPYEIARLNALLTRDPRRYWNQHVELGHIIEIPQQDGHPIITACELNSRFRAPEIVRIHNCIPSRANANEPYCAGDRLSLLIFQRLWHLNEIGMRESLYQSWSATEQRSVQTWMKNRGSCQRPLSSLPPGHLPRFF